MSARQSPAALEIRKTEEIRGGSACVGGTRIPVWLLVALIEGGVAEDALLASYPQLTAQHLRLVREYYDQHTEEIEHEIRT